MNVHILDSKKGEPFDLLSCGSNVATLKPYTVINTPEMKALQRRFFSDKTFPDQWEDPMVIFAPGRWVALSTALKFGRVVNAETGESVLYDGPR
jgi:hypothetical protein